MNKSGKSKFLDSLARVLKTKEDKQWEITGLMGRYNQSGSTETAVPNRPGYVWVRLRGQQSDLVQAFNDSIGQVWDLPVIVIKDPNIPRSYRVKGRDSGKPIEWSNNPLPFHGAQHSFGGSTAAGRDIVWVYKRQMVQPMLARPQATPDMSVYVEADYYYWAGAFHRWPGGSSPSMTSLKPSPGSARFVLVYFDGGTASIKLLAGTPFNAVVLPADITSFIPTISPSVGMPLAAAFLVATTSVVNWDILYDVRIMMFTGSGGIPFSHGLDPSDGYHTGFLKGQNVTIADPSGYFASSNLEYVLADLYEKDAGGSVSTDTIWDAKGDIAAATGPNHAIRVPVGVNGQVLTADSGESAGVKWVDLSGVGNYDHFVGIEAAPDGGWVWFTDPRAVYYNGQTFFAYVDSGGLNKIRAFNHTTLVFTGEFTLKNIGEIDDHDNPSILIRDSDKRLMTWYNKHDGPTIYQRISTNPEDATAWGAETSLDASIGGMAYDYTNPIQLLGEASDPIYIFYRESDGGTPDRHIAYTKSTNGGSTWSAETIVYEAGGSPGLINYLKVAQNGDSRIDFLVTNGHPYNDGTTSQYHFYYQGGAYFKSDGSSAGSLPLSPSDLTLIYNGTANSSGTWNWDIAIDPVGNPVVVFAAFPSGDDPSDHVYFYGRWSGTAWVVNEIVHAGGPGIGSDVAEDFYSGGLVLDHADPTIVYLSKKVNGSWEMYRYQTPDGGVSWAVQAITTDSGAVKNVRPVPIRNHPAHFPMLWLAGRYTTSSDIDMKVMLLWEAGSGGGGSGDVATDAIWDAAGDLAVGTGSDTAVRLPVGTDGQVLTADSGEVEGVKWADPSGVGAATNGVEARYSTNAAQSFTNSTDVIVNFEDQVFDTNAAVTTGASWKFTAPHDGYYLVESAILWANSSSWTAGGVTTLGIYKNGTIYSYIARRTMESTTTQFVGISGGDVIHLAAGDYIDIRAFQNTGGALALHNDGLYNYVDISEQIGGTGEIPATGWMPAGETWTYVSADGPTGVFSVPSDVTGKYGLGMRVKYTQTTVKYGIITGVGAYSGGVTNITIYGGTDYTTANAAITLPYYSVVKVPFGFNTSPSKWTVIVTDTADQGQASPVSGTVYNLGTLSISIPIGSWLVDFQVLIDHDRPAGGPQLGKAGLSTSNSSISDLQLTAASWAVDSGTPRAIVELSRSKQLTLTSKTTYYLVASVNSNGNNVDFRGDITTTVIRAVCAYL